MHRFLNHSILLFFSIKEEGAANDPDNHFYGGYHTHHQLPLWKASRCECKFQIFLTLKTTRFIAHGFVVLIIYYCKSLRYDLSTFVLKKLQIHIMLKASAAMLIQMLPSHDVTKMKWCSANKPFRYSYPVFLRAISLAIFARTYCVESLFCCLDQVLTKDLRHFFGTFWICKTMMQYILLLSTRKQTFLVENYST